MSDKADTSVFAGWGPAVGGQDPNYAISVIIPESGFGGEVAAPLAFSILAPASNGTLPAICPVDEPERSECEEFNAAVEAANSADETEQSADEGASDVGAGVR
ncbi:MAG: hypothetical protein ACR2OH_12680 [Microthrixaceae bacterium]